MSSINDKLERVRKPRVHIKYDVETEGAEVTKELPFAVGAIGDYAGTHPAAEQKSLKERKFIHIDQDNFDGVMDKMAPGVKVRVENTLEKDGSEIGAHLVFRSIDDFEPDRIVDQVAPLKKLKQVRDQLSELLTKADVSDDLESILEKVLQNPSSIEALADQLGVAEHVEEGEKV